MTEPKILTANTFYWKPCSSAAQRRSSEKRNQEQVKKFLEGLGFEIVWIGDRVTGKKDDSEVIFSYSESCKNVYKSLEVRKNGEKSNIRTLRKLYKSQIFGIYQQKITRMNFMRHCRNAKGK